MTNIQLLKKYATICKRQRDEAGCEECELCCSCWIAAIENDEYIDNMSIEELIKDIEDAKIPCRMIITISYSGKIIPFISSIISPREINNFFQNNIEDMVMPVINNVINAEWAECISTGKGKVTIDDHFVYGVQEIKIDVKYDKKIENYKDALSTEIEKVFKSLGLDTTIKIEFEE